VEASQAQHRRERLSAADGAVERRLGVGSRAGVGEGLLLCGDARVEGWCGRVALQPLGERDVQREGLSHRLELLQLAHEVAQLAHRVRRVPLLLPLLLAAQARHG